MKNLFIFILCFFHLTIFSQKIDKGIHLGKSGNDEFQAIIQDIEGNLVMVGVDERKDKDLYFVSMNLEGNILSEKSIDLGGNEIPTCIVQSRDNHFWVGGNINSKKNNNAFLAKINTHGVLMDTIFFAPNTAIYDLLENNFSQFWAVGEKGGNVMLHHFDPEGEEIWEEIYESKSLQVGKKLKLLPSNKILIAGNDKISRKKSQVFLKKIDINGKVEFTNFIKSDASVTTVNDLVLNSNNGFIIAGTSSHNPKAFNNIFISKTDSLGIQISKKEFGRTGRDEAHSITKGINGEIFITGFSQSGNEGNLKKSKMWLQQIDSTLNFIRKPEEVFYGGNKNDAGLGIVTAFDGSLIIAGYSESENAIKKDAWIKRIPLFEKIKPRGASAKITNIQLEDENKNGSLDFGEFAQLKFKIHNSSAEDILQMKVQISSDAKGISYPSLYSIGFIAAGKTEDISIPLNGVQGIRNRTANLQFDFSAKNKLDMPSQKIPIRTQEKVRPELQFSGSTFVNAKNKNQQNFFFLNIENVGSLSAREINVRFFLPNSLEVKSSKEFVLNKIPAQSSEIVFLEYKKSENINEPIKIRCQVTIKDFPEVLDSTFIFNPLFAGASSDSHEPVEEQLVWISPLPKMNNTKFDTTYQYQAFVKTVFISPYPLKNREVKFSIDNPSLEGSKIKRATPAHQIRSIKRDGYFLHFLSGNLKLNPKENRILVKISRPNSTFEDDFALFYQQPNPNLYLLSIGVPYDNLSFTTKDAADFAAAIKSQEGDLYNKVNVTLLNKTSNTTTTKIRKAIQDLVDLQITNQLHSFDVVMIFISSHGYRVEHSTRADAFKIDTRNLDKNSSDAIDFEVDILERLAQINCQRFNFVDACHSGMKTDNSSGKKDAEDEGMTRALHQIITAQPDIYSFMSCKNNELSWEHADWENGAYTEAILEIFESENPIPISDSNGDKKIITVQEIYNYLSQRVPQLVESKYCTTESVKNKSCTIQQTPFVPKAKSKSQLPLFKLQ